MSISAQLLPGVPLIESPLFAASIDASGMTEQDIAIARSLNERGYAVVDFPDPEIHERIARIKARLAAYFGIDPDDTTVSKNPGKLRVQDAWTTDPDVKAIAANDAVIALLGKLYGREAFPFQTLNFPVGTEQHPHSDSIHFSSLPERFMCGVWLAFEDTHPDAGPLVYYPGSHKWPIVTNAMIGRRGWRSQSPSAQAPFEKVWRELVAASGVQPDHFFARKGQALIWAANLLHGGSRQNDPTRTRWSQVTHYYFKDCIYYTPAFSDEPLGRLDLRSIVNIASGAHEPNTILGEKPIAATRPAARKAKTSLLRRIFPRKAPPVSVDPLPEDFERNVYRDLNPDVATAGVDPAEHYLKHGREEGRRYRID
ncbi:phytanoyl-CoA dioxygenase family protein [Sphingomonas sp. MMS24-J13]|uniref:phytanoyl-CoA dioxygenase family protein n=1 Tax=Sphingomonas sp. MMS24-J13 TaxID=3238686 RepID=UPI0038502BB7